MTAEGDVVCAGLEHNGWGRALVDPVFHPSVASCDTGWCQSPQGTPKITCGTLSWAGPILDTFLERQRTEVKSPNVEVFFLCFSCPLFALSPIDCSLPTAGMRSWLRLLTVVRL